MNAAMAGSHTNPFPGLRPFEKGEEYLFFGRESQVDAVVDKLAATRFLAVVGTSGSGKSSLVNCGLQPALRQGLMARRGTAWRIAQFRPGNDPIGRMAGALARDEVLFSEGAAADLTLAEIIETTLRMSKLGLIDVYQQASLDKGVNLLVVVDQFEELFRYRRWAPAGRGNVENVGEDAAAFVNLLLEVTKHTNSIFIVLTMRSDFLGECPQFPGLAEAINEGQYLVPRMTRDELRAAINGPVRVEGAEIAPVLLTRLVNDVVDDQDQLPILQHALNRTWAHWQNEGGGNGPLDLAHYEAIGTMAHALDQHAEHAYADLVTASGQQVCEKLFKALTNKVTEPRGVRRPTTLGHLCTLTDASAVEVTDVIEVFRDPSRSFLMPLAGEALKADTVIDLSHESLMRVWRRLGKWADEEVQSAQTYRRLADTADRYVAGNAGLWRDPELQLTLNWREESQPNETWAARYHPGFAAALRFLTESSQAREAERAEREQRRQRERAAEQEKTEAQARYARRMLVAALFGGALAATAVAAGVMAFRAKQEAQSQAERADRELMKALTTQSRFLADLAQQQRKLGDSGTALALAIEALPDEATLPARPYVREGELALDGAWRSLHERLILGGHEKSVRGAAFSPDGKRVVTASDDRTARLWDTETGESIAELRSHKMPVKSAAFSPDGKRIVTASSDHTAQLWDAETRKPIGEPLTGHDDEIYYAAFSPDGKRIVTASADKTARLWNVETGKPIGEPLAGHEKAVNSAAFSPNGRRIITASDDKTARLWDAQTGKLIGEPIKGQDQVLGVAFSPDGTRIVTASRDHTARLWDAGTGKPISEPLRGHGDAVSSAAFSPDGTRIVTASEDKTARLWDAETGEPIGDPLAGHQDMLSRADFSPDGKRIVTASADHTARLWDVETGKPIAELRGHNDTVYRADFSPDGKRIVSASYDKTARLWDAETGKPIGEPLAGHENWVISAAFSSDGKRIVTASEDRTARLWDAQTGKSITELRGHEGAVRSAAFSPDGRRIVTASEDKTAQLWDAETGAPIGKPLAGHEESVESAAFSPDGTRIVTASWDWTARLWDAETGKPIGEALEGHEEGVVSAAFSPDGKRIVSASYDNTARLWDAETRKPIGKPLTGHEGWVFSAAFSPDGRRIVTASKDKTVRLWDAETDEPIVCEIMDRFCGIGEPLTGHEGPVLSATLSPDGKRIVTASGDHTVRLWDVETGKPIGGKKFASIREFQEFVAQEKATAPRCLTSAQRKKFFLAPEPPAWCIDMKKWPYDRSAWEAWLAGTRAGKNPPLPSE
jgi:WD40 repeat protein